ncbi:MAG: Pr2TM family membrane protein [Anaerolineales bacterium]|nr:Pr2TM family membrane protein [Anaerolineales bacterium]
MENLSPKWRGFLQHFGTYIIVIGALAMINLFTDSGEFWFQWPALGWGVAIAFHLWGILLASMKNVSGKWHKFLGHFGSYVIIISMLALINLFSEPNNLWFQFPAVGWGAALVLHFFGLLLDGGKTGAEQLVQDRKDDLEQKQDEPAAQTEPATRKRQEKMRPRPVEYPLINKGQTNPVIHAHLDKALAYQAQIEGLIKATTTPNARTRLQELAAQVHEWVEAIEDLVQRIEGFQQNNLIRQDLETVPQAIAKLETQLKQETDTDVRNQLERTLTNRRNQLASLERLQNTMKRAEIQIESTLSALGTIYSQLLTGESTDHVADYSRLSSEVDEEVRLLQDRLEALEEVKLGRA